MEVLASIVIILAMYGALKAGKAIDKHFRRKAAQEYFNYNHRKNGKAKKREG